MVEWLRSGIEREFVIERDGWAAERADRVTERLQRELPAAERLQTIVVWLAEHTAFTAPGRTIYFGRRLLERLPDDDAAAFVIAHELAHHRLGHIPDLSHRWQLVPLRVLLALLGKWIASTSNERDADLLAIELCHHAGFDPERCVAALEYLDQVALDYGDLAGSFGDDAARASHPPTRRRISDVRAHLTAMHRGHRLEAELADRRRARRRRLAWSAGGAAVGILAFVLLRRPRPNLR